MRNTIVAVTGDHGEAFGETHARNRLHRDYIYEENVREFLILFDGRNPLAEPVTSHRVAGNGSILPTLTELAGAGAPGRSLLTPAFSIQPVFFPNRAIPEKWGVRDGRWKYIGQIRSESSPELFDLAADPAEQTNVAASHPEQVARYRQLCQDWTLQTNADYITRLK